MEKFQKITGEFADQYIAYQKKDQHYRKRISDLQREINQLWERVHGNERPDWIDRLLRPLIDEVLKQLPGWQYDNADLVLDKWENHVSVFFFNNPALSPKEKLLPENSIYMIFRAGNLASGELLYEAALAEPENPPVTESTFKPLENIEEAVAFLKAQIIP